MARKNIFADAPLAAPPPPTDSVVPLAPAERPVAAAAKPLLGLAGREIKKASPLGALGQSLESISKRAERAEEIERRLTEGQVVVELDPASIDASFISDRLGIAGEGLDSLVESVRRDGQQVPILVRPHPAEAGRYQIAYGHRRCRAAAVLGQKVRAVVRGLTDTELVVAQGQENNERADLSYIERARFAATLEARGFSRETIMSALSVDKAALSKMISIATRIPEEVIVWIGAAPEHGRHRWWDLSETLQDEGKRAQALAALGTIDAATLGSDARFDRMVAALREKTPPKAQECATSDGTRLARITRGSKSLTLQIDSKAGAGFGEFVVASLQELYDRYKEKQS